MLTKKKLLDDINKFQGTLNDYMDDVAAKYTYIEVQLWNDDYCKCTGGVNSL